MSDYHKLSILEKRAQNIATVRESAVTCPECDTQVMPADLLAHLAQRCTGPRELGPGSKLVTWKEARALGVPVRTLTRWVRRGYVRFKGGRGDRLYSLRDLAVRLAQRKAVRRR